MKITIDKGHNDKPCINLKAETAAEQCQVDKIGDQLRALKIPFGAGGNVNGYFEILIYLDTNKIEL
jgi:hypothetical protein